jgi:GNAT superfamily N-acetyltransferase
MGMVNIVVRPAVPDDVPLVLSFIRHKAAFDGVPDAVETTVEMLRSALFGEPPLAGVLLAEDAGEPVGFASYFFTFSTFVGRPGVWLDDLYVHPHARGRGAGTALMCRLAGIARDRGCGRIEWTVAASNERGLAFYHKHNATVSERARLARLDRNAILALSGG